MTKQFMDFFVERAKFRPNESWIDLVEDFGKLCHTQFDDNGELQDLINCANNPLVFIDKLFTNEGQRVNINIGFWILMQKFNQRKNILYTTPEDTGKTMFISGFILYKLLFTNDDILLHSANLGIILELIREFYDNLPEYLKAKCIYNDNSGRLHRLYLDEFKGQIIVFPNEIGLEIFDDIPLDECRNELSKDIPTIIMCRTCQSQEYKGWLVKNRDIEGKYRFEGLTFSFQDLGFGYEYFRDKYNQTQSSDVVSYDKTIELYNKIF